MFGILLLSACDVQVVKDYLAAPPDSVEAVEALSETSVLQDGVDAFMGYQPTEIPEILSEIYPDQGKAIIAFLNAFNLRALANEEGVSAWAKIRTSTAGETTWEYELVYLPDDAVYATSYKIYLEDVKGGMRIARIGHRVKCYRGPKPKQWTTQPCP